MANFFAMGDYALFVWPAYAITALVLGAAIVLCLRGHARAKRSVRRLEEEGGDTEEGQK